jgi:hypothetical protein
MLDEWLLRNSLPNINLSAVIPLSGVPRLVHPLAWSRPRTATIVLVACRFLMATSRRFRAGWTVAVVAPFCALAMATVVTVVVTPSQRRHDD